jgi:hypothetical protein
MEPRFSSLHLILYSFKTDFSSKYSNHNGKVSSFSLSLMVTESSSFLADRATRTVFVFLIAFGFSFSIFRCLSASACSELL